MQFLTDTRIDFMKYRKPLGFLSFVFVVGSLLFVFFLGKLNIGIDFAGGTQITLRFQASPDVDQLRSVLNEAGFPAAVIQRYGAAESHEVLIRTPIRKRAKADTSSDLAAETEHEESSSAASEDVEKDSSEGVQEGSSGALLKALDFRFNAGQRAAFDLNRESSEALAQHLSVLDPEGAGVEAGEVLETYRVAAEAILGLRRDHGIISSWDQLRGLPGISPTMVDALEGEGQIGEFAILSVENVGPQIGSELKSKGVMAILFSLLGMLAYIAVRFEIRFGVGAVVAIVHDICITLGLYALGGFEFNVTTIAGFLTLVGYSVNDTVVVFDRVRENMRKSRRDPLESILNFSINQTLSRTVMTSGTTLLVVGSLFFFGGDVLRGFSFLLLVGIFVGTYSSVFIASPVVLLWENYFGRAARSRRARVK